MGDLVAVISHPMGKAPLLTAQPAHRCLGACSVPVERARVGPPPFNRVSLRLHVARGTLAIRLAHHLPDHLKTMGDHIGHEMAVFHDLSLLVANVFHNDSVIREVQPLGVAMQSIETRAITAESRISALLTERVGEATHKGTPDVRSNRT